MGAAALLVLTGWVTASAAEEAPTLGPRTWPEAEQRIRKLAAAGDLVNALAAFGALQGYAHQGGLTASSPGERSVPATSARWLLRDIVDAALAAEDLRSAAEAAAAVSRADGNDLPGRAKRFADLSATLYARAGLSTTSGVKAGADVTRGTGVPGLVTAALSALEGQGAAPLAATLREAYDLALASESVEAETRAARGIAQVVLATPNLAPAARTDVWAGCAYLAGLVAGDDLVESAWAKVFGSAAAAADQPGARDAMYWLCVEFPKLTRGTCRRSSAEALFRMVDAYEAAVMSASSLEGSEARLFRLWATAARAADKRGMERLARSAIERALPYVAVLSQQRPAVDVLWAATDLAVAGYRNGSPRGAVGQLSDWVLYSGPWEATTAHYVCWLDSVATYCALEQGKPRLAIGLLERTVAALPGQENTNCLTVVGFNVCECLAWLGADRAVARTIGTAVAHELVARGDAANAAYVMGPLIVSLPGGHRTPENADELLELAEPVVMALVADPSCLARSQAAAALQLVAECAWARQQKGDPERADAYAAFVLEAYVAGHVTDHDAVRDRADYVLNVARIATSPDLRAKLVRAAREYARQDGLASVELACLELEAKETLGGTDPAAARQALLDQIGIQEQQRNAILYDPSRRQEWFERMQEPYETLLGLCARTGDAATALDIGERKRARTFVDQLRERQFDLDSRMTPEVKAERDRIRILRSSIITMLAQADPGTPEGSPDTDRGAYMPLREGNPVSASRPELREALDDLSRRQATFDAMVREFAPDYARFVSMQPPSTQDLAKTATSVAGRVVIEYSLSPQGYVGVVIGTDGKLRVHRVGEEVGAVDGLVASFRESIAKKETAPMLGLSRKLHDLLLAPFAAELQAATEVLLVPDGALSLLPFEALCDPEGYPLVQRLPVSYAPSLTVLGMKRPGGAAPAGSLLALGNPSFAALPAGEGGDRGAYMPVRGGGTSSERLRALSATPLPGTQAEIEGIGRAVAGSRLLSGAMATKAAMREEAGGYRIVHLATHAYADPDQPDYSAVLLAPSGADDAGLLSMFEVYDLRLNADLVTLSCCETGVGKSVRGEGVLGLSRAFITAGAREVVCSLWQVPDAATSRLMQSFYAHLSDGETTSESLRAAKLELLGTPDLGHPSNWAAFSLVRGPSAQ